MTTSTSFAQVATNLLNVLQGCSKSIRLLLVMFLTLTVTTNAWGADVTFATSAYNGKGGTSGKGGNATATIDGVTITSTKAYYTSAHIREYSGGTITVSSSSNITKIVFTSTASGTNSNGPGKISLNSGGGSYSYSGTAGTWTGSSTSIKFDCDGQFRWTKIVVTIASSHTVTWTINPAAGGTLSATNGTSTTVTPNSAYTYGSPAYTVTTGSASVVQSTNTFTATPSAICTIRINMVEKPKYTVTLKDDNSTLTQSSAGKSVTLPHRDGCAGYKFVGWTKSWSVAQTTWTTTAPTIIPTGSYTPTANENLYPVYTKTEGGGSEPTAYSAGDVGSFIIASNVGDKWYAIPDNPTLSSGKITGVEITVSQTAGGVKYVSTANAEGYTWIIANATNGQTISDGSKYIYHSNGGGSGTSLAYGNGTSYTWKIEKENNGLTFKGMNGSTTSSRGLLFNGSVFGGYALSNEDASGYYRIQVLPIGGGSTTSYISVPDCTTEATVNLYHDDGTISGGGWTLSDNKYTQTVETTNDNVVLPTPVKEGYTFGGWYEYSDFTGNAVTEIEAGTTGTKEFYAKWTINSYTLTWDLNGGKVIVAGTHASVDATGSPSGSVNYNVSVNAPEVAKEGHYFTGWTEDGTNVVTPLTKMAARDVTYIALWEEAGCPEYSFHTGGDNVKEINTQICFEPVGSNNEWQIVNYVIPADTKYFVGHHGYWYENNLGSNNSRSVVKTWSEAMYLAPAMDPSNPNGTPKIGQATGAVGTIRIFDNSNWDNLYVGFIPNGYKLKFGTTEYAFTHKENSEYLSDIVEYNATSANYNASAGITNVSGDYVATDHTQEMRHIFVKDNIGWRNDGAKLAIYYWNGSTNGWCGFLKTVPGDATLFEGWIPASYTSLKFVRFSNTKGAVGDWNDKWNETGDLTISSGNNLFTITDWGTGSWSAYSRKGKFRIYNDSKDKNWYLHFYPHFVLKYDANGGESTMEMQAVPKDASDKKVTIADCGFTRTGYNFVKWNKNASGTSTSYNPGATYTLSADVILYAQWEAQTYNITYKDQGNVAYSGSNAASLPNTHTYATATTLVDGVKMGYTFGGWYDNPECTGTAITQLGATDYTSDITLYAKWTVNTHTLTWDVNGGNALTGTYTTGEVAYGTVITKPADPTRTGYTFQGWHDGTSIVTPATTMPDKDLTYTAQWQICLYTLTWNLNGGTVTTAGTCAAVGATGSPSGSVAYGTTITAPVVTCDGYRFDGWHNGTAIVEPETTMGTSDLTYTAQWTEVYTITWYENGVPSYTYVPSDNAVVTWEDNIADCGEKKFYGWTADDTFVSDPTTPPTLISKGTTIACDVTYYAVYADAEVPANPGYTKVTTISEGTYLIATGETSDNLAYTGKYPEKSYGGTCEVIVGNSVISTKPMSAVEVEVTLGTDANSGKFAIYDGTYYLSAPNANELTFNDNIVYDWQLTAEGYINSTGQSDRYIQLNSSANPKRFACYTTNQKKAYLYKKQTTTYENFAVSCATYKISVTTPTGGTVTTTPADEAGAGQTITVNVTPADCKYLAALKYNYNDGSDHNINIASYTFTMPAADVTVTATFADKTATDIEILTSAHRMLMQGSAFVGEQVRITYNNGDKETLNWNDSRLTFTGYNTATLGSQTVTVTYNDCGTQSASYNIEVIDGLGITFWDDDYTETIKYEPGDLVDVDNKIGQNICSGWEFVGWSETKVANKSNGFTPVHNFNATDAKVLYAVYAQTSTDWISAYNIDELHSGAKYVIVAHYADSKEYALTNTNNTNSSYLDGAHLTTDCEQVREGDAYPYKDRYKLKVTPQPNWKWQLVNTGSGWTMRNISANKYLKINTDKSISLTTTPDDKFTLSNGSNDSEITAQSSSNNYLSWYNSSEYWNGHTSGKQYYLTNETNFTSTPPCSPLSATFYGNGGIVTDGIKSGDYLPIKEPTRDAGITTPTAYFADCNGKSWTFVGWSRKEIDVTRVPVLTTDLLHDGGGNKHYYIQENGEEFWAVYTNQGTPETKYGTITFTDDDVTTQYENAKKITKSVTAMGDYDFELYHVSDASNLGIQFDNNDATKGYIKNITSLGKINSISLNDFQTGNIDDVKVYVGNTSDAINTLLTEADLQQTGNTYTYYPQKNYAYVKIEANGYCGITSISIDFGKGTQIWATTPDCSTITLSGDELYVTSTNGQSIRAAERLTVKAVQLESKAKVVISSNSSDIYFSDVQDANFTQAVKPTETLTLTTDVDGNLSATEIYVHYRPSVDGTGIPEDVVVSANLETPNPSITDDHTIHVRNLPADFVIAAKWGENWYAMPANMNSQSSTEGLLIEVDDAANPTKAFVAPNTTKYGLKSVYTSDGAADRYADNGERLVFVENVTEITPVANKTLYNGGGSGTSNTNIQVYAQYTNYYNENPDRYEWIPTTIDLTDYTLTSAHIFSGDNDKVRTVSLDNHGVFGTLLQDKSYNGMVRLLPVDNFYAPAELQVVEWKQNSVSVMYTGAGSKATTKVGSNEESAVQLLSDKNTKIDHAVYSLATTDLTAATNQPLVITIKDDAEATIGVIKLTIPAIVAADKSSTELGVAEANAKATSIVVLDGATLTASTTKYTYDDVVVYPGGKLVIGQSGKLGMYTLTLRLGSSWGAAEYEYKYPQFVLNTTTDGAYSNTSGQINLDYVTTKDQYYTFVAPFEVKTNDIKYPIDIYGTNVATNNSGSFEFEYYDGAARAAGNTGWTTVAEDPETGATLNAGQGYTFLGMPKKVSVNGATSTRQKYGIHRIPMKVAASAAQTHENTDQTVPLAVTLAEKDNDSGWNIVGNPYMSNVEGLTNNDIQVGELVHTDDANGNWTGKWHWDNPTTGQRFLVIPSNDGQSYDAVQAINATLHAFKHFFVQINNEDANAMSIPVANRVEKSLAPARYAQAEIEKDIEIAVQMTGDKLNDQMDFLINDIYSTAFEKNADFTKMMNATNFNIYGVHVDNNLSFVALDKAAAMQSVAIGFQVPKAGEYQLKLSDKPYVMADKIEALFVTDHEASPEVTTNLVDEDYTFYVNQAETNNTRFTVSIILKPDTENTPTGVDNIDTKGKQPIKFLYQDKIYILRNGMIYDTTGKQVITINK